MDKTNLLWSSVDGWECGIAEGTAEGIPEGSFDFVDDEGDSLGAGTFELQFSEEESKVTDDVPAITDDDVAVIDAMASSISPGKPCDDWKQRLADSLKSTEELKQFVSSTKNKNTVKKTMQVVKQFQKWLKEECMEEREIQQIAAPELDSFMANYFLMKKKADGTDYEPDSLTAMHRAILRHLRENDYPYDAMSDGHFTMSREVLQSKRIKLKESGKGNRPNKAEAIDDDEMEQLWVRGALGASSPQHIQDTLYFFITMCFGARGCHEASQMLWGDVEMKKDHDLTKYLEFTERATKTRNGTLGSEPRAFAPKMFETKDDRCPVKLYQMFEERRPGAMLYPESPFYLTLLPFATINDTIGYKKAAMGENTLNEIVKNVCRRGGLAGKKTNHSLRKTALNKLMAHNVPPVLVAQLSGHRNVASLNNYSCATRMQQRGMSHIVTKRKSEIPTSELHADAHGFGGASSSIGGPSTAVVSPRPRMTLRTPTPSMALATPDQESTRASTIEKLAQSASGMFVGAHIQGNINLNITYNVSNASTTSTVTMSPVLPAIQED